MASKTAHKRKPAPEGKMRRIVVIIMEVGAHPQQHQQQQQQKKLVSGGNDSNDIYKNLANRLNKYFFFNDAVALFS